MILFKESKDTLYVRAEGHVTARSCAGLKEKVFARFEREPAVAHICVDLTDCEYMDSTFLGLLAGFTQKLEKTSGNKLNVQHINEVCDGLIRGMGLDRILIINQTEVPFPDYMEPLQNSDISPETLLAAHEDLMDLSAENRQRFSALHSLLSSQLDLSEKKEPRSTDNGNT